MHRNNHDVGHGSGLRGLRIALGVLVLGALLPSRPAFAGDFVDTRINFTLTDENMLVKPGETNPNVPGFRISRPNSYGILFFENYDTRFTGYENLTHLVLYKKVERGRFVGEASLALRLLEFSDVNISTIDDSSYIKVAIYFDKERKSSDNISLTAFPMSADRLRLGYSYRLSWGGSPIFFKYNPDLPASATPPVNSNPAPGARLQYTNDYMSAWVGFKTSVLLNKNPLVSDLQAIYGVLGGISVEAIRDHLRLELNGGWFDRGNNPNFYPTQSVGPGCTAGTPGCKFADYPVQTFGASFQISLWNRLPPSLSLDYQLYRNDPTTSQRYFAKPIYMPGFAWLIQSEATYTGTTLQDFDKAGSTTYQNAYAADINVRAQYNFARFKLDASVRSLEFILLNQPSLVPYTSFPKNSGVSPDIFFDVGFDYHFPKIGMTVGPTFGVDLPANITPPEALPSLCGNTGGTLCRPATIVVRGEGDYSILPITDSKGAKVSALPVVGVKLVIREDFLEYFGAILDINYSHDPN